MNLNFAFPFPVPVALMKRLTFRVTLAAIPTTWPALFPLVQSGRLKPEEVFTHRLGLSDAAEAYRIFDAREDGVLKVLLDPAPRPAGIEATVAGRWLDLSKLEGIVGAEHLLTGDAISDDYTHDEALTATPRRPLAVVRPAATDDVAEILTWATEHGVPVTARGSGTGLSGACIPREDGILVSFERMAEILEIDDANHVAVVQPGRHAPPARRGAQAARARVPGVPRRELGVASAATSPPTPAACARCATASPATRCSGSPPCSAPARCCAPAASS